MEESKSFDYPLGFLREIDGVVKDEILKVFIECAIDNSVDLETIPDKKLRAAYIRLLMEADRAAAAMEGKLASIESNVLTMSRAERRRAAIKNRAKKAGLITLEPKVPKGGKLITE